MFPHPVTTCIGARLDFRHLIRIRHKKPPSLNLFPRLSYSAGDDPRGSHRELACIAVFHLVSRAPLTYADLGMTRNLAAPPEASVESPPGWVTPQQLIEAGFRAPSRISKDQVDLRDQGQLDDIRTAIVNFRSEMITTVAADIMRTLRQRLPRRRPDHFPWELTLVPSGDGRHKNLRAAAEGVVNVTLIPPGYNQPISPEAVAMMLGKGFFRYEQSTDKNPATQDNLTHEAPSPTSSPVNVRVHTRRGQVIE